MSTINCTLTYVRTLDKGTNETTAPYHFGYGRSGQRYVTCYKVTVPSYTGSPSGITFTLNVNRGTAYPTDKTSTWKIGLDNRAPVWSTADGAYTAGSEYAKGYYYTTGSLTSTFSGTITSSTSTFTSSFTTTAPDYVNGGSTFYVYLYAGENNTNSSIKLTGISAYVTYSTIAVTGTTLLVGTSPSLINNYGVTLSPSYRTCYFKVTGLQNQVKQYSSFKLMDYNPNFTDNFVNGGTYTDLSTLGDVFMTYSNSSSNAYEFTTSFTVPSEKIPIVSGTATCRLVMIASTLGEPNRYWKIGTYTSDSTMPQVVSVVPYSKYWFLDSFSISSKPLGKTSVQYTVTQNIPNYSGYAKWVGVFTNNSPYDEFGFDALPSNSIWDYDIGSNNLVSSSSGTQSFTYTETGLNPGTTYERHGLVGAHASTPYYAEYDYYGIGRTYVTTDANYTATLSSSDATIDGVTLTLSNLNTTTNLNDKWYVSTENTDAVSSISIEKSANRGTSILLTGLNTNTSYTRYAYVYSSESKLYYKVGTVTFTTQQIPSDPIETISCATGITATQATIGLLSYDSGDTYYVTDSYQGVIAESLSYIDYETIGNTIEVGNLIPGRTYTFYFYVKDNSNNYNLVSHETFETYSSLVYYEGSPYRMFSYDSVLDEWVGLTVMDTDEKVYSADYYNE